MSNDSKFSIKLADGKERTFDSAAEMAQWIQDQRANSLQAGRNSSRASRRKLGKPRRVKKVRCYSGDSPLARYANRNSDEI